MKIKAPKGVKNRYRSVLGCIICFFMLSACSNEPKASWPETALNSELKSLYDGTCALCHDIGGTGAPLTGDAAAWSNIAEQGIDKVVENAILGKGGMPARGQCFECTEDQIKTLIYYMANPKRS